MRTTTLRSRRQRGFHLLELAVVIAIVSIVITMLLPAIQHARAAARKLTCLANLKQIGIALHNYHDTYASFPPPYTLGFTTDPPTFPGDNLNVHSWGQMLLPFLGEHDIFNQIDMTHPAFDSTTITNLNGQIGTTYDPAIGQANVSAISEALAVFNCPDVPGGPRIDPFSIDGSIPQLGFPFDINYVIASSDYYSANGVQCEFYYGCGLGVPGFYTGPPQIKRDGIMAQPNEVSTKNSVCDGLSQTFLIVERAGSNDVYRGTTKIHDGGAGPFVDVANEQYQAGGGWGDFINGEFWPSGSLEDGTSPIGNGPCLINCVNVDTRNIYSFHPGGVNVLMADGSAIFISETLHTDIVAQLFSKNGGSGVSGQF
jgi:prepilin-type N-terminal cleavage/methylation domain-containing protein/prepilin-type processing-associated H-X9-DG protein